jgi:hypothetical protein
MFDGQWEWVYQMIASVICCLFTYTVKLIVNGSLLSKCLSDIFLLVGEKLSGKCVSFIFLYIGFFCT